MIRKTNSQQIAQILEESTQFGKKVEADIVDLKTDLANKLTVMKNVMEFNNYRCEGLQEALLASDVSNSSSRVVYALEKELHGSYEAYGSIVHPKFAKTPDNIFNFASSTGHIFKNNANVTINGLVHESNKAMLMHDSIIDKGVCFFEFDTPKVIVEIELNLNDLLGDTATNLIEIAPYIPGSFNIDKLEIFEIPSTHTIEGVAATSLTELSNVGTMRVMLEEKYRLHKCTMEISLNYRNSAGRYPFGIKHLYFLCADYTAASHVIAKVSKKQFIDWISDNVFVNYQSGPVESTCTQSGITLFMNYNNGILEHEIQPSKTLNQNLIARNTKEFYFKFPLNKCVKSVEFENISAR